MHWSLFIFFNHENDRKELLFLSLEKNCCWGVTFCNNAFGYLIKLHYTWTVLTICFLFPDHWLLLEEVQHWIVWAAEQNCTNSRNFTYYAGPLCWLLPQWVIIVELQFFRWGHCKLLLLSHFSVLDNTLPLWMLPVLSALSSTLNSLLVFSALQSKYAFSPFWSEYPGQ